MAEYHQEKQYRHHSVRQPTHITRQENPQDETDKWYFSQEEIQNCSPSRKDGIEAERESHLRMCYCTFLQNLGMRLEVPQVTIACAMLLCHRFYMRQSHSKNDWQTIATVSMFLASKVQDTPCYLRDVVVTAYEMIYAWDPSASTRIRQRDFFSKQKELIFVGERLLLATIGFDLDIELPYKPLVAALNRLNALPRLAKIAWNFINDWIRTTLCLQYKPHVIAAASMFIAAKHETVEFGKDWWLEFGVPTKQLKEVVQKLCGEDRKSALPPMNRRVATQPVPLAGKPIAVSHNHASQTQPMGVAGKPIAAAHNHAFQTQPVAFAGKPIAVSHNHAFPYYLHYGIW